LMGMCSEVVRCASVRVARVTFQACSFNHSDISPAGVPDARPLRVGVVFKWNQQLPAGGRSAQNQHSSPRSVIRDNQKAMKGASTRRILEPIRELEAEGLL
jgi:hypothetical protein